MKPGRLSATTGYVLSKVCKAHYSRARALLDDIGLYRGQQFVLCRLWEQEGLTHSQLAERLHVHPATVTKTLRRMEQAGFIERRPDAEDQRVSRVYLTPAGRESQAAVERVWARLEEETFQGFSEKERETLEDLLEQVYRNLQGQEAAAVRRSGAPSRQMSR